MIPKAVLHELWEGNALKLVLRANEIDEDADGVCWIVIVWSTS
jgi:hypothetical protein